MLTTQNQYFDVENYELSYKVIISDDRQVHMLKSLRCPKP